MTPISKNIYHCYMAYLSGHWLQSIIFCVIKMYELTLHAHTHTLTHTHVLVRTQTIAVGSKALPNLTCVEVPDWSKGPTPSLSTALVEDFGLVASFRPKK